MTANKIQHDNDFTFPPKVVFIKIEPAGLLTFLIFSDLPIPNEVEQWLNHLLKTFYNYLHQDYSYGDSSGFKPDSLLMIKDYSIKPNPAQDRLPAVLNDFCFCTVC